MHEVADSDKLGNEKEGLCIGFLGGWYFYKRGGYSMPVELLVPVVIFGLGVVVAMSLGSMGIERIIEK